VTCCPARSSGYLRELIFSFVGIQRQLNIFSSIVTSFKYQAKASEWAEDLSHSRRPLGSLVLSLTAVLAKLIGRYSRNSSLQHLSSLFSPPTSPCISSSPHRPALPSLFPPPTPPSFLLSNRFDSFHTKPQKERSTSYVHWQGL
jgi:hypothetical protein